MNGFPNLAGRPNIDDICAAELEAAGIEAVRFEIFRDQNPEVKTAVRGQLPPWRFSRNWRYWVARGPGIPPCYAAILHEKLGKEVRVEGHCGCPSPLEWHKGFAVGLYHVDTPEGLKMLADTIKLVMVEAERRHDLEKELREARAEAERLRAALERLANAADVFAADQSRATDPRCGRVQPITVADGNELLAALRQANQIIERSEAAAPPLTDAELAGETKGVAMCCKVCNRFNPHRLFGGLWRCSECGEPNTLLLMEAEIQAMSQLMMPLTDAELSNEIAGSEP